MNLIQSKLEKRAERISQVSSIAPFVRMIGLTGSVARGQANEKSDIDFFVFSSNKRMWTCRFFVTLLVSLTGKRRHGKRIAGRVCLNRYQTIKNLEVTPHNEYNAWDYSNLTPLINSNNYYYSYQKANKWMEKFGGKFTINQNIVSKNPTFGRIIRLFGELFLGGKIGDKVEEKLRNYQLKKIKKNPLYDPKNPNIIIGNDIFCSHIEQKTVERS